MQQNNSSSTRNTIVITHHRNFHKTKGQEANRKGPRQKTQLRNDIINGEHNPYKQRLAFNTLPCFTNNTFEFSSSFPNFPGWHGTIVQLTSLG